jgi:hypothetical protein
VDRLYCFECTGLQTSASSVKIRLNKKIRIAPDFTRISIARLFQFYLGIPGI